MAILERTAKLNDVAREAGVSQGTVSNVFNRPDIVSEEVRERVLEVAGRLGYRGADPKGRLLRAGKVNAIGVATIQPLSYFFTDPYAREVMDGIADACTARGAGISLVSAASGEALSWNIRSAVVDGFILFCMERGPRLIELTRERQLPFVALAFNEDDPTIPSIGIDNAAGARAAAEHLLALGHRHFGILSFPLIGDQREGRITRQDFESATFANPRDRLSGYLEALEANGVETNAVPIMVMENDEASVGAAMAGIFAGPKPPTALLVQADLAAMFAIRWLTAHGYDVPRDVSVVGFDGVAAGATASPPLTTVAQPMVETGRRAVEMILSTNRSVRREVLPLSLVVRGSTAPPRA